jgi:hypothetical protein
MGENELSFTVYVKTNKPDYDNEILREGNGTSSGVHIIIIKND